MASPPARLKRANTSPILKSGLNSEVQQIRCKSEPNSQVQFGDIGLLPTVSSTPDNFTYLDLYGGLGRLCRQFAYIWM